MRMVGMLACALALAACNQTTGSGPQAAVEMPPSDWRQIAVEGVKSRFKDPYTIRDAEIAPPKRSTGPSLNDDGFNTPWVVCIRANAKNSMGAYIGRKVSALAINGSKVVNLWEDPKATMFVCDGVAWEPFPEIEEGYRPPAPPARARR